MKEQTIKQIMTTSPVTVQYQTPLKEIINILAKVKQAHLPVVNEANKLIGLVSQIDCHKALFSSVYHGEQTVKVNDIMLSLYTHATSRCKVSKGNCADILGIKLKPSHSKSKFYNDVDWYKLPCPTGRKLENQPSVTTIEK
ncbi:CBS domain-containing protein [Psychromonas sp. Urea-02u-13]|uniref:CBS domain-containing protein n=1 Tax=Psychromonas sp. Urea-02u-13 TaxID=2058326 RepID=UPI000C343A95|nr:CBS domain-containing protein [Psychromonas sp. Urea-02u-13]PKG40235.1 hypothetical protein CXF74_03950 [Psychromonas sp. Urea-02u-13]